MYKCSTEWTEIEEGRIPMLKLTELSQDELKYICEHLLFPDVRCYFQNNPKDFAKIRPGFRAEKLSDADTLSILVKNASKPFISVFIERVINDWISQIETHRDLLESEGYSEGEALLKTIPDSIFCDKCELYFKLAEQDLNDDYLRLFRDALTLVQKTAEASKDENHNEATVKDVALLENVNEEICVLRTELEQHQENETALQESLHEAESQIRVKQEKLDDVKIRLQKAETSISEMQIELAHYRHLNRYADEEFEKSDFEQFQYISIGQIGRDYNGQKWIIRLADIVDGEVSQFFADDNVPHCFNNRDRLYWKNGPDDENAIGIWNWRADQRDTDPSKDFIICEYNQNVRFTEVVEFSQCKTISDVGMVLTGGFERNFTSEKVLFVFTTADGAKEGLLCLPGNLEYLGTQARLTASVFMLPHYSVKSSDIIKIADIQIFRKMNLGIPQSVFRVRTPYDAVKRMVLSRATIPALREHELSKKEAQQCRRFLEGIPPQTLIQELSDIYACTEKEAQEYIDDFIKYADTYLSAADFDMKVLSNALGRNPQLVAQCKMILTDEWEKENFERLEEFRKQLEVAEKSAKDKLTEAEQLILEKNNLVAELESLQQQIEDREQLAVAVEKKTSARIEEARQNVAEFISKMAFISPASFSVSTHDQQKTNLLRVFQSHMEYKNSGEIDDIDSFEEELTENYMLIGYEEETAVEMAQAVSFCICNQIPIIVGENVTILAQCLAATINGGNLSEVFISSQDTRIEHLMDTITAHDNADYPTVYLLHGMLDGYSVSLYNALVNLIRSWDKNVIILISLEGIPAHMVPAGVWSHAIYIDGDAGLQSITSQPIHAFRMLMKFERPFDGDEYKEKRRDLLPFSSVLSNMQISLYAKYLSLYDADLNECPTILNQMVATVRSLGDENKLNSLFHDSGVLNGEKMLEAYI